MKATAQMGGLTREDVEDCRPDHAYGVGAMDSWIVTPERLNALCDLALQALSLESAKGASEPEMVGQHYWAIERGSPAMWWKVQEKRKGENWYRGCWVGDIQLATLYSHKEYAEKEMQLIYDFTGEATARVSGHVLISGKVAPPPERP